MAGGAARVMAAGAAGHLDRDSAAVLADSHADRGPVGLGGKGKAKQLRFSGGIGPCSRCEALEEAGAGGKVERSPDVQLDRTASRFGGNGQPPGG